MKKRTVKLSVADPCHEDWEKMTPKEQGRFCSVCSKVVVDFSKMSDQEVLSLIDGTKSGDTCGQFTQNQLDKTFYYPVEETSRFSLKAVLVGATLTSLLSLESCKSEKHVVGKMYFNQSGFGLVTDDTLHRREMIRGDVAMEYDHHDENLASGIVYNDKNVGLIDVKISLFNASKEEVGKSMSRNDGSFRLSIDWKKEPVYFRLEKEGYVIQDFYLKYTQSLQEMNVTLVLKDYPKKMGKVRIVE